MDTLQEFVYLRTYARWIEADSRRETFPESVDRCLNWLFTASPYSALIPPKVQRKAKEKFLALDVVPSMRAFWSAGPCAERNNISIYNCSGLAIDRLSSFWETLLLLMHGTGVGFSIEPRYVSQLPEITPQHNAPVIGHVVDDSTEGWMKSLEAAITLLYEGRDVQFDYSQVRPMGTPLRTKGGRASGPEVLRQLHQTTRELFLAAQGRQLTPLECHDLLCSIARCVVVGGVRRSALISLSSLQDHDLRHAKRPPFPQIRFNANNSAVYRDLPDVLTFLDEFTALAKSGTGERGIFNLYSAKKNAPHRRKSGLIELTNPCAEVTLRNREFCNLTEAIVRSTDTFEDLLDKVTTATWLGVIQSTFTNFPDLPTEWEENCEDERLIGVSLSGQYDHLHRLTPETLKLLQQRVVATARKAAKTLGIRVPAATTCVKPSGTVSQMVGCSAGIHPRHSQFYLRNMQISVTDPLFDLLTAQKVPIRSTPGDDSTAIVSFPVKSPEGAITRHDVNALDQLEHYKIVTENWCEMNASCTIYVASDEWLSVAEWVHRNWECVNGLSFFPKDGPRYDWLPYEELTEQEYLKAAKQFPKIDFSELPSYEQIDVTTGAQEFACVGGGCDV